MLESQVLASVARWFSSESLFFAPLTFFYFGFTACKDLFLIFSQVNR